MIFYIDETVRTRIANDGITEKQAMFFSELAFSYQHGHCILCGNLDSINQLSSTLEGYPGSIYRLVAAKYTEHRGLMEVVSSVFVLSFASALDKTTLPSFLHQKCRFLPIEEAMNCKIYFPCSLLGENLTDCDFYKLIGKYYCAKHSIQGITIDPHVEHGGGNPISKVLHKCVQQELVPTLCIVDSDRKYGKTKRCKDEPRLGSTYCGVRDIQRKLERANCYTPYCVYPLHVHEAENLIPLSVIEGLSKSQSNMKTGLDFLHCLKGIYAGSPLLYYDLKNGVNISQNPQRNAYWNEIAEVLGESLPFPNLHCNDILEDSVNYISMDIDSIVIDDYLIPFWDELGNHIVTWCCGFLPRLA